MFLLSEEMFLYLLKAIRVARTSLYSKSSSIILQFITAITLLTLSFIRSKQQSKITGRPAVLGISNTAQQTLHTCNPKYEQQSTKNWQSKKWGTPRSRILLCNISRSAGQKYRRLCRNQRFSMVYRLQRSPSLSPIIRHFNPAHTLTNCFLKIHVKISKQSLSFGVPNKMKAL